MRVLTNHVLRDHVLIGGVAAAGLLSVMKPWDCLWFYLASILIDVDHYFHYLYYVRLRDWTPGGMFRFHHHLFALKDRPDFLAVEIFHTIEFQVLAALAAWRFPVLRPALWGMFFHIGVDVVHLSRHGVLAARANSFFEYALRRRSLLARGLTPDWMYDAQSRGGPPPFSA